MAWVMGPVSMPSMTVRCTFRSVVPVDDSSWPPGSSGPRSKSVAADDFSLAVCVADQIGDLQDSQAARFTDQVGCAIRIDGEHCSGQSPWASPASSVAVLSSASTVETRMPNGPGGMLRAEHVARSDSPCSRGVCAFFPRADAREDKIVQHLVAGARWQQGQRTKKP